MSADRYDPATVRLVAEVLHQEGCEDPCPGNCASDAVAVLNALTAAGKLRRSPYAADGEPRCGEPYPGDGPPCQLRPGHDAHARPASGGFDAWRREDA
jgi:hypothetical protein